jgi:hypothetical protein
MWRYGKPDKAQSSANIDPVRSTSICPRSKNWWCVPTARFAPMWCTGGSKHWDSWVANARHGGWAGGGPGRAATQNRAAAVSVDGVRYSVPHTLADSRVWVRFHGDELIVTAVGDGGPVEVARHRRSTPALRRLMRSTIHRAGITTVTAPHGRIHRRRPAARSKRLQHNAPSDIVSNPQEW